MRIVQVGANAQHAVAMHGFEAVLDHVVKRLLYLIAIELKHRQIRSQLLFNHDFSVLKLGRQKANCFLDNCVQIFRSQLWPGRPDGLQELRDDGIQPVDFGTGDLDRLLKLRLFVVMQLLHTALNQLQVNVQRVKRITDLVRNACRQQHQRIQTFRLNRLLRGAAALSDVAQDHYMANFFG